MSNLNDCVRARQVWERGVDGPDNAFEAGWCSRQPEIDALRTRAESAEQALIVAKSDRDDYAAQLVMMMGNVEVAAQDRDDARAALRELVEAMTASSNGFNRPAYERAVATLKEWDRE